MCATRPSTYCIWIVIVVHSFLIIMLLLKLLYLILSLLFFALSWKKHPLHPSYQGLEGARHPPPPPPPPPLVNLQLAMQFLIKKAMWFKNKSQGNCEHRPQFILLAFIFLSHFYPLKTCYLVKKVSAEQNAGHVQLCHYFIWQVMTCLINVVIDNGYLSMRGSLEAANCTM
jgi:hypothetical protein